MSDQLGVQWSRLVCNKLAMMGAVSMVALLAHADDANAQGITGKVDYVITTPPGFDRSNVSDTSGGFAVGMASNNPAPGTSQVFPHAILWDTNGTTHDLHPKNGMYSYSQLRAVGGEYQVGAVGGVLRP